MIIAFSCLVVSLEGYDALIDWPRANPNVNNSSILHERNVAGDCDEEAEGVQSKESLSCDKRDSSLGAQQNYLNLALSNDSKEGRNLTVGMPTPNTQMHDH
ncbi:hypothetical protein ACFX13_021012 [Malus domestica]